MKASETIKELQFMIDNYGDVDVVIPECVKENTPKEYHKYTKYNRIMNVVIGEDENYCTCIWFKV